MAITYSDTMLSTSSYQLDNLWDFTIVESIENYNTEEKNQWTKLHQYRVVSINIPFPKLETETLSTGEKVYTKYIPIDNFSIELREDTEFSTYTYFKNWLDIIFNFETYEFNNLKNGDTPIVKGSVDDTLHRDGILSFHGFVEETEQRIQLIQKEYIKALQKNGFDASAAKDPSFKGTLRNIIYNKEVNKSLTTEIVMKEIRDNAISALMRRAVQKVNYGIKSFGNGIVSNPLGFETGISLGGEDTTILGNRKTKEVYKIIQHAGRSLEKEKVIDDIVSSTTENISEIVSSTFNESSNKKFILYNMKVLGFEPLSLNYENGNPLSYTINLTADFILEEK